jgi:hypothetical protein
MAPTGQNSWQQKHRMQALLSMEGQPFSMVIALFGQILLHVPQPVQVLL